MNSSHADIFREEANELLAELESSLIELEKDPASKDLIAQIFRAMHTIKGSGAMFGFDDVATFTHDIENIYDLLRNGRISADKPLIALTLSACDVIRAMVDGKADLDKKAVRELSQTFKKLIPAAGDAAPAKTPEPPKAKQAEPPPAPDVTYRIRFQPESNIFTIGIHPALMLDELRELGVCTITAQTDAIPALSDIDPEMCYVFWDIVLTTSRGLNAIKDVFIFVEDHGKLTINVIDDASPGPADSYKKIGEILAERGDVAPDAVSNVLAKQKKIGEILVETGLVDADRINSALAEQKHVREMREKRQVPAESATSIRVPAERLDRLINMVGELVTVQSRLSQLATRISDSDLALVAEEVERLTAELRDNAMSIRMLPIGNTFSKFKRLVHDLSTELGKEIQLVTEGGETELDKTVIEKLSDPLVHIIRNSIDHGIEIPQARQLAGKAPQGIIRLTAEHSGANVLIRIADDGAGMNPESIRQKALERNLIAQDAVLSEKEILSLIFAPGFSMAKSVTSVSGRGVGMDVVKKGIDSLGGSVEISSRLGAGTTMTLKLPLTLAIIDGLLVRIEDAFFVIPLAAIEECVELTRAEIDRMNGKHIIKIRDEAVPYLSIRERFRIAGKRPPIEQIIINRVGDARIGLVVDAVVEQHQTVIKNLGKFYRHIKDVSGATILGDGTVALIIDVAQLTQKALEEEDKKFS